MNYETYKQKQVKTLIKYSLFFILFTWVVLNLIGWCIWLLK